MQESVVVAAFWGGLAAISLIIGAVVAVRLKPSERVTGAVMGFGAGALTPVQFPPLTAVSSRVSLQAPY